MMRMNLMPARMITILTITLAGALTGCKDDENTAPSAPTVRRVYPASGGAGETVSISGTGFSIHPGDNIVSFNGTVGEVLEVSGDTALRATVPAGVTTGPVSVANRFRAGIGPVFTAIENPNPPVLTSLSQRAAESGESVVITGMHFKADMPYRNIVEIGGITAPVSSVTETEIVATVPFRVSGAADVVVTVFGAASNALSLDVTALDFHAYWLSTPAYNISDSYAQFVMAFDSRAGQVAFMEIPDDSAATKFSLKYPLASPLRKPFPAWYEPEEDALYVANTNDNTVLKVNKGWGQTDFTTLYDGHAAGLNFTGSLAMTGSPVSANELFLAAADPSTGGAVVSKIMKDGTGVTTFSNGPFGSPPIHAMACSKRYLYTLEGDPGNGAAISSIRMIDLHGDGTAVELDPSRLPPKQLGNSLGFMYLGYSRSKDLLYFIYDDLGWPSPKKLYSMDDAGTITLLNDQLPYLTWGMNILDTSHGALLFIKEDTQGSNWSATDSHLYVMNLNSPGGRLLPVQSNMHYVPGHAETIFSSSMEYQYYAHTLMIDNE